jgi:light-regulated signal transduction histidine kinase (bacteriophytochrome)
VACKGDGDNWLFSIQDDGIGIDPQQFEHIFLLFKRLHAQHDYPGSGIGLAKCKKVVTLHGGEIWINSEANAGTTFFFTIPNSI